MTYLSGERMTGGYGGADIISDCTIGVERGEIAVIVGPNGAGKSTAMKALLGMLDLREGRVSLDGATSPRARRSRALNLAWRSCRRPRMCSCP